MISYTSPFLHAINKQEIALELRYFFLKKKKDHMDHSEPLQKKSSILEIIQAF